MIPVLLIDDHPLVAHGLSAGLASEGVDVRPVGAPTGPQLPELLDRHRPVLVLLDLHLGDGRSGFDLLPTIVARPVPVLVLTATDDDLDLARALADGARGFVRKTAPFAQFVAAITTTLGGGSPQSVDERRELLSALSAHRSSRREHEDRFASLTAKEREVLVALCGGSAPAEIAAEQFVSLTTVRTHIRAIHRKLDVRSQAEATSYARAAGWDTGPARHGDVRRRSSPPTRFSSPVTTR